MEALPNEIQLNIFRYLPINEIFRLRVICSKWKSLLEDPMLVLEVGNDELLLQPSIASDAVVESFFWLGGVFGRIIYSEYSSSSQYEQDLTWMLRHIKSNIWIPIIKIIFDKEIPQLVLPTLLFFSCFDGGMQYLQRLCCDLDLDKRKRILDYKDPVNGRTALHSACFHSNAPVIQYLLENNVNMESREKTYGQTPLLIAVQKATSRNVVELLVNARADVHAQDSHLMGIRVLSTYNRSLNLGQYLDTIV